MSSDSARSAGELIERLATAFQRETHTQMPVRGDSVGVEIPPSEDGLTKRDRVQRALEGKSVRELGEIMRRLGARTAFGA